MADRRGNVRNVPRNFPPGPPPGRQRESISGGPARSVADHFVDGNLANRTQRSGLPGPGGSE